MRKPLADWGNWGLQNINIRALVNIIRSIISLLSAKQRPFDSPVTKEATAHLNPTTTFHPIRSYDATLYFSWARPFESLANVMVEALDNCPENEGPRAPVRRSVPLPTATLAVSECAAEDYC